MRMRNLLFLIGCFAILACDTVTVVGGRTIGISSGEFINQVRSLPVVYNYPLDEVWTAAEKTLQDLKAKPIEEERKIAFGRITGYANDEKIILDLKYLSNDRTEVTIMAGITGDLLSSRLISERIEQNIKAKLSGQ